MKTVRCKLEIIDFGVSQRLQPVTKERMNEALLNQGNPGFLHDVPGLLPEQRLPDNLAELGSMAPYPLLNLRLRTADGLFTFSVIDEASIEYILTHLAEEYEYSIQPTVLLTQHGRKLKIL